MDVRSEIIFLPVVAIMAVANHHHFCNGNETISSSPALAPLKLSTTEVDSEYIAICMTNTNPIKPLLPVNFSNR